MKLRSIRALTFKRADELSDLGNLIRNSVTMLSNLLTINIVNKAAEVLLLVAKQESLSYPYYNKLLGIKKSYLKNKHNFLAKKLLKFN